MNNPFFVVTLLSRSLKLNRIKKVKSLLKRLVLFFALIILIGLLFPQRIQMPVSGATDRDFNHNSFWFHPWGKSVTHKGVDIFAKPGTPIKSATRGLVVHKGENSMGGNIVVVLGAKWRFHYYAHMDETLVKEFQWVDQSTVIGTVGDSGNAKGKPAHLHYTIATFLPRFWKIDKSPQGWRKMFYDNPIPYIRQ